MFWNFNSKYLIETFSHHSIKEFSGGHSVVIMIAVLLLMTMFTQGPSTRHIFHSYLKCNDFLTMPSNSNTQLMTMFTQCGVTAAAAYFTKSNDFLLHTSTLLLIQRTLQQIELFSVMSNKILDLLALLMISSQYQKNW